MYLTSVAIFHSHYYTFIVLVPRENPWDRWCHCLRRGWTSYLASIYHSSGGTSSGTSIHFLHHQSTIYTSYDFQTHRSNMPVPTQIWRHLNHYGIEAGSLDLELYTSCAPFLIFNIIKLFNFAFNNYCLTLHLLKFHHIFLFRIRHNLEHRNNWENHYFKK